VAVARAAEGGRSFIVMRGQPLGAHWRAIRRHRRPRTIGVRGHPTP
jgi:hypothetical protein